MAGRPVLRWSVPQPYAGFSRSRPPLFDDLPRNPSFWKTRDQVLQLGEQSPLQAAVIRLSSTTGVAITSITEAYGFVGHSYGSRPRRGNVINGIDATLSSPLAVRISSSSQTAAVRPGLARWDVQAVPRSAPSPRDRIGEHARLGRKAVRWPKISPARLSPRPSHRPPAPGNRARSRTAPCHKQAARHIALDTASLRRSR